MKYSNYKPSEYGSINTKTKFQIGGYYKILWFLLLFQHIKLLKL
jgi:uncharacterized membrane protein YozB (DUF420 family)